MSSRVIYFLLDRSILLVFCCTLLGAAAQVFLKMGATQLVKPTLVQILTNFSLLFGYSLYGCSTMFLVLALRRGQLSILYPVIALTYVWVTILSVMIFRETMNPLKGFGLGIIVGGVALLGIESGQKRSGGSDAAGQPELVSATVRSGRDH